MKYNYTFKNFDNILVLITEFNLFNGNITDMSISGKIDSDHHIKDFDFDNNKHQMTSRMRIEYVTRKIHPELFL